MNNSLKTIIFIGLLVLSSSTFAQNRPPVPTEATAETAWSLFQLDETIDKKEIKDYVRTATMLRLDKAHLQQMMDIRPQHIQLNIPTHEGQKFEVVLKQETVLTPDFIANTSTTHVERYEAGLYYQGHIKGNKEQRVAISVFNNMIMGLFLMGNDTYILGHLNQNTFPIGESYVLYKEADVLHQNPFACGNEALDYMGQIGESIQQEAENDIRSDRGQKSVKVYFEADYQLYKDKNRSTTNVLNYVTGLFNNVKLIYENENIIVEISETFVWTSNDPYPSSSSVNALMAFQNRLDGNFNGDVAHLIATAGGNNGGIAYVDVLCIPTYAVAYSNISSSYNNFPFYSWTVNVVSHEMGHNLGSHHTQSCVWPGGAIDNCYPTEGACTPGPTPINGGTVMSYCHLTSIGTNLNNGFGNFPGDKIRAEIAASHCLSDPTNNGGGNSGGNPNLTQNEAYLNVNGTSIEIGVRVVNTGLEASSQTTVDYYLSNDANFSSSDYYIGSSAIAPLGTGYDSGMLRFSKNVANDAPTGTYRIIFVIDSQNDVLESNENDNIFSWVSPLVSIEEEEEEEESNGNGGNNDENTCRIDYFNLGQQTPCDAVTNTYSQDIIAHYSCDNEGIILIYANNELMIQTNLTGEPQLITLTNLIANGEAVKIEAFLCPDNEACSELIENDLFIAPANCHSLDGEDCTNFPSNGAITNLTTNTATVTWDAVPGAIKYEVATRRKYTYSWGSWFYKEVNATSLALTSLVSGTKYQYKIRTKCADGWTNWAAKKPFTTLGNLPNTGSVSGGINNVTHSLEVYPNPAQDKISLKFHTTIQDIRINNLNGKLIKRFSPADGQKQLDISDLQQGIYFISVISDEQEAIVTKFVKL